MIELGFGSGRPKEVLSALLRGWDHDKAITCYFDSPKLASAVSTTLHVP